MRHLILPLLLFATGCSHYVAAERELVTQSRRAVALSTAATTARSAVVARYHAMLREQLDDAFDADVCERQTLTSDWVIESRRAYAAGLDALHAQRQVSERATSIDLSNLSSADEAMQKLDWLLSLQSNVFNKPQPETK